jgi:cyclophilin family peptidyl-prolyl cis-trans isomerase/HEAT repeat protein
MQTGNFRKTLCAALLVIVSMTMAVGQKVSRADNSARIPTDTLLRILRYEDERRWDAQLSVLLAAKDTKVRKRAALATGRIGDERAVPALVEVLKADIDSDVRQMAAFAIGEIESPAGADALIAARDDRNQPVAVRARAVEALGKIAAVLLSNSTGSTNQDAQPRAEDKLLAKIRLAILDTLKFEAGRRAMPDRLTILLGLTAALRARPDGAGPVIIGFLGYSDPRLVADALNTMARLRLKDGSDQVRQLLGNGDPIVRANAARVIGAAEDKQAFDALLARALNDYDLRVRVSAIRALGSLKDERAADELLRRGEALLISRSTGGKDVGAGPVEQSELLEIVTTLGRVTPTNSAGKVLDFLRRLGSVFDRSAPEVEIALARLAPSEYWADGIFLTFIEPQFINASSQKKTGQKTIDWRTMSALAQGLNEAAAQLTKQWESGTTLPDSIGMARVMGQNRNTMFLDYIRRKGLAHMNAPSLAIPDVLRAFSAYKPADNRQVLLNYLKETDVVVRSTSADLLGELKPDEANTLALSEGLPLALRDKDLNDAALSILDALAKQKSAPANDAIKTALDSSDHLVRRRAVSLLKANGVGDFSDRIGTVKTRNTDADYRRAIARIGKTVTATVVTSKGAFTIEFLPNESPLTVDNFVQLARKGYFNGQTVPRVVPNFVIQTGDPRGDQNGGPGYQIRCEINEAPYERGAVGMALSGKDTGGSQWFVTHSPQPHLDGGYTVFGRVIRGMDVVDHIARGDTMLRVVVNER